MPKGLKYWENEVYPGHFTVSFEDTINVMLKKLFPHDPVSQDSPQLVIIRLEAELDYKREDDVFFLCTEIDCVINNLSINKSTGIDRINNEMIKKFHKCCPSVLLAFFNSCLKFGFFFKHLEENKNCYFS